jgi:hypothetical protein
VSILQNKTTDLAVYHAGEDISLLFDFYKSLRRNAATENVPLLVIAVPKILKTLADTVEMSNTAVIGENTGEDDMMGVIESMLS